jgi:ABC-type Fe3+-siderophore transport system permease subunit
MARIIDAIFRAAVARNSIAKVKATFLSLVLLILILVLPWYGERSSEVTSSITAFMASRRLMSQVPRGKVTCLLLLLVGVIFNFYCSAFVTCVFFGDDCGFACGFCYDVSYGACEGASDIPLNSRLLLASFICFLIN